MKRVLLVCLVALTALATLAFWVFATRGVELADFSHRIGEVLQSSQTTVTGSGFEAAADTPLPLLVKWNPRFWLLAPETPSTGLGTGARGEIYYVKHGSAVMECRVRRTSEVVEYVEIRCQPQDRSDADLLRDALARAFSGLVVRVRFV